MIGAVGFYLLLMWYVSDKICREWRAAAAGGTAVETKRFIMCKSAQQLSFVSRVYLWRDSEREIKFYFLTFSLISFELSCSFRSILKLNGRLE